MYILNDMYVPVNLLSGQIYIFTIDREQCIRSIGIALKDVYVHLIHNALNL